MNCLTEVSKDLNGDITVIHERLEKCTDPHCATLRAIYRLAAGVTPHVCDAFPELDGFIRGRLEMYTKNDGGGRGYHVGYVRWRTSAGWILHGRMRGTTNDGTHRAGEACDRRGHLEGVMIGDFIDGPFEECSLVASYVINYDPGQGAQDTAISGAIEGVRICPCNS